MTKQEIITSITNEGDKRKKEIKNKWEKVKKDHLEIANYFAFLENEHSFFWKNKDSIRIKEESLKNFKEEIVINDNKIMITEDFASSGCETCNCGAATYITASVNNSFTIEVRGDYDESGDAGMKAAALLNKLLNLYKIDDLYKLTNEYKKYSTIVIYDGKMINEKAKKEVRENEVKVFFNKYIVENAQYNKIASRNGRVLYGGKAPDVESLKIYGNFHYENKAQIYDKNFIKNVNNILQEDRYLFSKWEVFTCTEEYVDSLPLLYPALKRVNKEMLKEILSVNGGRDKSYSITFYRGKKVLE